MGSNEKVYFTGLNGIRALAAIGVLMSHTMSAFHHFGLKKMDHLHFAHDGVTIFFTLSGFLITYLLMLEKQTTSKISFKNFYIRRILRIWPLYFLYILLVVLTYNLIFDKEVANMQYLWLTLIFLPNISASLNIYPTDMGHMWSIGIEEQYYAFWPLVVSKIKNLKRFLIIFIVGYLAIRVLLKLYGSHVHDELWFNIVSRMRFDCMATGALFAIWLYEKNSWLMKIAKTMIPQLCFWAFVILSFANMFNVFSMVRENVISVFSGLFIISQVISNKKVTLMENKVMFFLGKISYGIYVYHPLLIAILAFYSPAFQSYLNPVVVFILVLLSTVGVAWLSYNYIENAFLKLKKKFEIIKSGKD